EVPKEGLPKRTRHHHRFVKKNILTGESIGKSVAAARVEAPHGVLHQLEALGVPRAVKKVVGNVPRHVLHTERLHVVKAALLLKLALVEIMQEPLSIVSVETSDVTKLIGAKQLFELLIDIACGCEPLDRVGHIVYEQLALSKRK